MILNQFLKILNKILKGEGLGFAYRAYGAGRLHLIARDPKPETQNDQTTRPALQEMYGQLDVHFIGGTGLGRH